MNDAARKALAKNLKSAFEHAVFLGYSETSSQLRDILDQVEPLTYLEQKAARYALTEAQLRISLERSAGELRQSEMKAARERLEEQVQQNKKSFTADILTAKKIARIAGETKIAAAIASAKKVSLS